jgi:biotin operon repressor
MNPKPTQSQRILKLLQEKDSVTNIELNNDLHIFRYGARIAELREQGYNIESKHIKGSVWEFRLVKKPKQLELLRV